MKYPPLEHKLRTYRFEQLQTRHLLRYWFHGIIALISVMALLVALFREQLLPAVFLVFTAVGFALLNLVAGHLARKRALEALQRELPQGETYEPPQEVL
ncbi:MAG: hypothetical protein ACNA7T_09960 [Haliea sp.]